MKRGQDDIFRSHVTGESVFVNDMEPAGMLHGTILYSSHAHAKIVSLDISEAVEIKGVKAVMTFKDIPGNNQVGPVVKDEPCLAEEEVFHIGQAIVLIAADSLEIARRAKEKIHIDYTELPTVLTIEEAIAANKRLMPDRQIECGDVKKAFANAEHIIEGSLKTGAQEHWYLETQSSLAVPGENREMNIYSSTQHPSETQEIVSGVLGVPKNLIAVETRRLGGAFGGKETQANPVAAWSALLAWKTGKPVKIHLFRDDDQIMTGKRHRFLSEYRTAFTPEGKITALDVELNQDAGFSADLSGAILQRAMFHVDNAYFIPNLKVVGRSWKTNLPSFTAFRGFGGPQGMAVIENIIDVIARKLKMDPLEVRRRNLYGTSERNITHYGQLIRHNRLGRILNELEKSSEYHRQREEADQFNSEHSSVKRGLALTPQKFGISFTTSFLNQAGALVNLYKDGSVVINHGGIEMGQGLNKKILDIACGELGVTPDKIRITPTNTMVVPNTSATAASSGSDLNGKAVQNAIAKLKRRLVPVFLEWAGEKEKRKGARVKFSDNLVTIPGEPEIRMSMADLASHAHRKKISLSATGYYRTPGIHYDQKKGKGSPFYYYSYGMAASTVEVDLLTGHVKILRTDILQDAGKSINKEVDLGQVAGAFIQGVGWCTTEEIKWDEKGRLLSHSPDTYKLPTIAEMPQDFRIKLLDDAPHPGTIKRSKAIGEPPFMLALSVWLAVKDAISAVAEHQVEPEFSLPATYEVVVRSAEKLSGSGAWERAGIVI